uniref:Uncharacterized protein n=1 Tax=Mycena chlorophos TaxID=658473 RepID=A0ABQ0LED1_MYCCL|nr:predicted protein [Mycena chlorophos]
MTLHFYSGEYPPRLNPNEELSREETRIIDTIYTSAATAQVSLFAALDAQMCWVAAATHALHTSTSRLRNLKPLIPWGRARSSTSRASHAASRRCTSARRPHSPVTRLPAPSHGPSFAAHHTQRRLQHRSVLAQIASFAQLEQAFASRRAQSTLATARASIDFLTAYPRWAVSRTIADDVNPSADPPKAFRVAPHPQRTRSRLEK